MESTRSEIKQFLLMGFNYAEICNMGYSPEAVKAVMTAVISECLSKPNVRRGGTGNVQAKEVKN